MAERPPAAAQASRTSGELRGDVGGDQPGGLGGDVLEPGHQRLQRGARLLRGGVKIEGPGFYYPPTVLLDPPLDGALMRVRPIMMTVATIIVGLLPIMLGSGTGSEVMRRIAAPMVGGMISATLLTLVVIPAVFLLWQGRSLPERDNTQATVRG